MRKRYQRGSLRPIDGKWLFQWYDTNGKKRKKRFGSVKEITKSEAQLMADTILAPINAAVTGISSDTSVDQFIELEFFPWFRKKWKNSTRDTTEERIRRFLVTRFKGIMVRDLTPGQLQQVLEDAAAEGFVRNTVNHVRWDMKHIFRYAVSTGILQRNPAEELFTPRRCSTTEIRVMTLEEVNLAQTVLSLRERLIFKLGVIAGMRPGEIFALRRRSVQGIAADIRQRVYKGDLDTPKTSKSVRQAALANSVLEDLEAWLKRTPSTGPEGWLFPSANLKTPISRDNFLTRQLHPRLDIVGLGWVNFLVLRKTHSTLMADQGVDPKIVADQQGHDVDVNLNVYAKTSLDRKKKAVDQLDAALLASKQSQTEPALNGSWHEVDN
jgi:integrase